MAFHVSVAPDRHLTEIGNMTLRYRLFLVYLIVVLLSVATVGIAIFELNHSREIIASLQRWNSIVLKVQELKTAFERDTLVQLVPGEVRPPPPKEADFAALLEDARDLMDTQTGLVRWEINKLYSEYEKWQQTAADPRTSRRAQWEAIHEVRRRLDILLGRLETRLAEVQQEAQDQDKRTRYLLISVMALTAVHVFLVGMLLRRWLLRPMERLNRQVEALAHDRPPEEPLLTYPLEMANLAYALDRARQSLGEMRHRLIESERMTTIGQFAAQLAHNLRNPLSSIRAVAQLTARQDPGDGSIRNKMDDIVGSVDRLNRWIAGLMEIARREPTPTSSSDVVPALYRVREAFEQELKAKDLELDIQAPEEGIVCVHDPNTLEHALIAMLLNAIEASPLNEKIDLRAERFREDGRMMCRISVNDRGKGLPEDNPEQIFEFSYSTKQRGMGLGLALARMALQRQGGSAHACKNSEGGATVYVDLPLPNEKDRRPNHGQSY
jgi:signal transduction histidine kinase